MLREPLEHVQSLLLNTYLNIWGYIKERLQQPWMQGFQLPAELETWTRMAPAVVNNYYTRTLLGKWVSRCSEVQICKPLLRCARGRQLSRTAIQACRMDHLTPHSLHPAGTSTACLWGTSRQSTQPTRSPSCCSLMWC